MYLLFYNLHRRRFKMPIFYKSTLIKYYNNKNE